MIEIKLPTKTELVEGYLIPLLNNPNADWEQSDYEDDDEKHIEVYLQFLEGKWYFHSGKKPKLEQGIWSKNRVEKGLWSGDRIELAMYPKQTDQKLRQIAERLLESLLDNIESEFCAKIFKLRKELIPETKDCFGYRFY